MEKFVLWYTEPHRSVLSPWVLELDEMDDIRIVAIVGEKTGGTIGGCPVVSCEDIKKVDFDRLLICGSGETETDIRYKLLELGLSADKVLSIYNFMAEKFSVLGKRYDFIIDTQCRIIREILEASDEDVANLEWMRQKVKEYGVDRMGKKKKEDVRHTLWGLLQDIDEFAQFCIFVASLQNIKTAIEVGVFKGRSSYFICALLSRNNPQLKYTCVDIRNRLDSVERFMELLPALDIQIPSTSEDYKEKHYDFVFIDADHSYDASMQDYLNVGQYANNVTVFHDIYGHEYDGLNGGIVRTFQEVVELTKDKEHRIFSTYPDKWLGIGTVIWK